MYADVVVLTYQPPKIKSYAYKVPKDLEKQIKIGQLVQVPFGTRNPLGVVTRIVDKTPKDVEIKPISSIAFPSVLLLSHQIKLLEWLSFYYHAPMVNCLEAMLPAIPKRLPGYQVTRLSGGKIAVNQTIILVPTINRIPETLALFPKAKNYVFYHNQLKTSEKFTNWLKIKSGQADFVFGSRNAIFTPCPNLKKIIIFDEHDGAYKDERSPYFDTLTVAEKLKELTGTKIQIIDTSPRVTTYFLHKNEIEKPKETKISTRIISMADEKSAGNFSPISSLLATQLRKVYQKGGRSLLFINKKIESGQVYCKNCHYQTFVRSKPESCPNCHSPNLWFYSLNINTLSSAVCQAIPKANINLIAEGIGQLPVDSDQLPVIDIATSSILYAQTLHKYDLLSHILIDSTANIADLTTSEKVFSQIRDLARLTKENGIFIIQTNSPQNQQLKDAIRGNYRAHLQRQLLERKMLSYPPFALLLKLTLKGKNQELVAQKATRLVQDLRQSLPKDKVMILGPYQPALWRPISIYNIILKRKLKSNDLKDRERAIKSLSSYLGQVPRGWQITVEPASLN